MIHKEIYNHDNLKAFRQHGFSPVDISGGNQVYGNCIFCEDENHFYINFESKKWDCKKCGMSGGYKNFISEVLSLCKEQFTFKESLKLSRQRGLKAKTLLNHSVGYNPFIESYVIPTFTIDNVDEVLGLKIFPIMNNGKLSKKRSNTFGLHSGYLGGYRLKESFDVCWIVEGEWDYFTWYEVMKDLKLNDCFIGLPQATSFKEEYVHYFKNKTVHVLLDNDPDIHLKSKKKKTEFGAGIKGMIKIYNKIASIVKSIDFIHWPKDYEDGYDVNDCYRDNKSDAQKTYDQIVGFLNQYF